MNSLNSSEVTNKFAIKKDQDTVRSQESKKRCSLNKLWVIDFYLLTHTRKLTHSHIHTLLHTYLHTLYTLHTLTHTYFYTHMHTHIHIHVPTHIHKLALAWSSETSKPTFNDLFFSNKATLSSPFKQYWCRTILYSANYVLNKC